MEHDDNLAFESVSESKELESTLDELEELEARSANHQEIVAFAQSSENYCPQYAQILSHFLNQQHTLFGLENTPSFEDYEDLAVFYGKSQVSLEGFIARMKAAEKRLYHRLSSGLIDDARIASRKKAATHLRAQASEFTSRLKEMDSEVKVSLKGVAKQLAVKGQVPSNLGQAAQKDVAAVKELFTKYVPNAVSYNTHLQQTLTLAVNAGPGEVGEVLNKVFERELPARSLSTGLKEGSSLMGNRYIMVPDAVPDEGSLKKRMAHLNKVKPPQFAKLEKVKENTGEVTLSRNDVSALIKALSAYAEVIENANTDLEKVVRDLTYEAKESRKRSGAKADYAKMGEQGAVTTLSKLVVHMPVHATRIIPDAFNHIRANAKAIIQVLERAGKPK